MRATGAGRSTICKKTGSGSGEIVRRTQDAHATPRVEDEEIIVTADDRLCSCRERELQILVILWITAIGDPHYRREPDGGAPQYFHHTLTSRERNCKREPGAVQNPGDLGIDRGRKSKDIDFFGAQQSALRNAVHFERRAYQG